MLDIHSHILPKMDDGSSSVEESLKLLRTSAEQGTPKSLQRRIFTLRSTARRSFWSGGLPVPRGCRKL